MLKKHRALLRVRALLCSHLTHNNFLSPQCNEMIFGGFFVMKTKGLLGKELEKLLLMKEAEKWLNV